jgi:hypothetical protein
MLSLTIQSKTILHALAVCPGGGVPTSVTIRGRLASENPAYGIYRATGADGGSCSLMAGLPKPINPAGEGFIRC